MSEEGRLSVGPIKRDFISLYDNTKVLKSLQYSLYKDCIYPKYRDS